MIVCSCNVLSDKAVRGCVTPGPGCPRTAAQVYQCLGCSPRCGRCARTIREIVDKALGEAHAGCASTCGAACPVAAPQRLPHHRAAAASMETLPAA